MKRLFRLIICFVLAVCFSGCCSAGQSVIETENEAGSDTNVLVAYFSRTGNTKPLAEYAADFYGADIYEILAKDPYTDEDINYGDSNSRTSVEQNDESVRPEIEGEVSNMDQYDTIILAYPIWWGQAPRIIDTFMESYDFSGKTIVPFCTSASSDIGFSDDNLYSLTVDTVNWIPGKRFAAGTAKETLIEWLSEVLPEVRSRSMKLCIEDKEIPVIWEENDSVRELMEEAGKGDITVEMSMYSDNEQVGSLGRSYTSNDQQTTTYNGDIVLYNSSNIVVFYGSNSWSYTRLGKMQLSEDEITDLLSNGDVTITIGK